jgi:hypothetical protein
MNNLCYDGLTVGRPVNNHEGHMEPMATGHDLNMGAKRKAFAKQLIGKNVDSFLASLDSAFSEGDEAAFKDIYGISISEGRLAALALMQHIHAL